MLDFLGAMINVRAAISDCLMSVNDLDNTQQVFRTRMKLLSDQLA